MKTIYKVFILIAVLSPFASCLKDDTAILKPEQSPAVVEFKDIVGPSSSVLAPYRVYVPSTLDPEIPEVTIDAVVNYVGPGVAPSDIVVNLTTDPSAVTSYNSSEQANYFHLPTSAYEFPATVTIKAGTREAQVPIKLKISKFDQSKENVLAMKIASATNTAVSGNFGTVIYSFPVKSVWEGTYTYTIINDYGTIDGNIGGTFTEEGVKLSTVGPNKLYMQYLWRTYSGYAHYQFSGDNTTITSIYAFSGSARATTIDKVVVVDPVNRIFEVWWTGIGRGVKERFVRTGD